MKKNTKLYETAAALLEPGKGILAADESDPTAGKRLAMVHLANEPEHRQKFRELLFTAPDIEKYLSLALRYAVCFTRPTIYVLCGLPASGKSTIANELSAILHVGVLRSDRVRKQLFNIPRGATVDVPVEKGIYSPGATALTYGRLFLLAQESIENLWVTELSH